ncbi:hypothetical protein FHR90_002837 [Endobacter medicaginis]|uniref:Uncharacterized protein n=1 Tax=Endobacter medicaginis TaxID=1181271 RepID=A0A850NG49_9PROT|nr:hypothetical protein [Endobacter medicaginis]MBB3174990.1 hypothetical protein [Endobacter medicaginis]MCX5475913.1 hypothetical protein [Endobacter medicaginis]NVN28841.1 hypothetical protein [Endobacter medicaginis]
MSTLLRSIAIRAVLGDGSVLALSELDWDVSRFARAAAFTFKAPLAIADAAGVIALFGGGARIALEILADSTGWSRVLLGRVDRMRWDAAGGMLMCEGRDLGALLLDYRIPDGYLNRTSSEIAISVANACGLAAQVIPTTRMVGQFYQIEHRRLPLLTYSARATAWDLLSELALMEGCHVGLSADTLVFGPLAGAAGVSAMWSCSPGGWTTLLGPPAEQILLSALPEIATDTAVRVRSWNSRQRSLVDTGAAGAMGAYDVMRPNLADDDAQALAQALLDRIRPRSSSVQIVLPGELALSAGDTIGLTGTQTAWDGLYRLDEIERSISVAGGFRQYMTASTLAED